MKGKVDWTELIAWGLAGIFLFSLIFKGGNTTNEQCNPLSVEKFKVVIPQEFMTDSSFATDISDLCKQEAYNTYLISQGDLFSCGITTAYGEQTYTYNGVSTPGYLVGCTCLIVKDGGDCWHSTFPVLRMRSR